MTQSLHDARPVTFTPSDSTFGARLAMLRQHMRWGNVAEAARQCGVPTDSWRNWEEGMRPREIADVAKAISRRTGCDLNWLVFGPSRDDLERRLRDMQTYPDPLVIPCKPVGLDLKSPLHMSFVPGIRETSVSRAPRPRDGVSPTRAVEQTRPIQRPRASVPLPALS